MRLSIDLWIFDFFFNTVYVIKWTPWVSKMAVVRIAWLDSFPTMAAIFGYELLDDLGVPHFRMEHDSEDRLLPVPECLNGSF